MRGGFSKFSETLRRREVGRRMLYVGFGSISGMVHLIARLPLIGRAAVVLLVAAVMVVHLR